MRAVLSLICTLLLAACASSPNPQLAGHADDLKSYKRFGVCYGYACKNYQKTGLSDQEWQAVRNIFSPEVSSAKQERERIAKAIAMIEQFVGPKTGTDHDKARAPVINFSTGTEMDCIDESTNSTSYLYLMRQDGLIRYHTLGVKLRRNWGNLSYPHSTATIHEIDKDKVVEGDGHFVVDSWFHKNGALAEIIPASVWRGPWYPEKDLERYIFSAS
tara:strand:- start:29053 stop:29700 length:648 start_codon:yes stop_codon:yes gene_type:complete